MALLSNCTLKVGAQAVAAAYFRGANLIELDDVLSINSYRVTSLSAPIRCRVREVVRNSIIVRNMDASNTVQIGFTTNPNSNRNNPATWVDIPPDYEWHETGSSNQVFLRAKVDAAQVVVEVETSVMRGA